MQIQPGLVYLTRADWGANRTIPRLGTTVARSERTEAIIHHTVIVDSDATKNLWTNLAEVKSKMRQLQVIRPDLGMDVPYNFVMFLMEDGTIVVCEGRGLDRRGAHTKYHNRTGMATALQGNFMLAVDLSSFIPAMSRWWGWLRYDMKLVNLGSKHPVGRIAFGHVDLSATACPGDHLYAIIPQLTFKEDDMGMTEAEKGQMTAAFSQIAYLRVELGLPHEFDPSQEHESDLDLKLQTLEGHAFDPAYHHSMDEIKAAVGGGRSLEEIAEGLKVEAK